MNARMASLLAFALIASACQQQAAKPTHDATATAARRNPNAAIIAAAEPFEALTEQAPSATWARIDELIGVARTQADSVRQELPRSSAAALDRDFGLMAGARLAEDRLGIALSSVEGYRTIVEAQNSASAAPPIPVSLLDYAGFRYDALSRAPNVDWREMTRSADFARRQWAALRPEVRSAALADVVDNALSAMNRAAADKNVAFARSAAATELALVDVLEEQLARR